MGQDNYNRLLEMSNVSNLSDIANKLSEDFMYNSYSHGWTGSAVNGGTGGNSAAQSNKHPGIIGFASSTSANSGGKVNMISSSLILVGGEKSTIIFKTPTVQSPVMRKFGFHTSVDAAAPIDGVYIEINDGVLVGKTAINSVRSATPSNYNLSADTWYRAKIEVSNDLTKVTFTLYADDSNTVLWTDTLATNIPIGKAIGSADVATSSGTTVISLGQLDYIDMVLPNVRRVV